MYVDHHCLVHWAEEKAVMVVKMTTVEGGSKVGDECQVKIGRKRTHLQLL